MHFNNTALAHSERHRFYSSPKGPKTFHKNLVPTLTSADTSHGLELCVGKSCECENKKLGGKSGTENHVVFIFFVSTDLVSEVRLVCCPRAGTSAAVCLGLQLFLFIQRLRSQGNMI